MADSLAGLQDAIEAFVAERDWAQFHTPKNLAMGVAIEAAEIMEHFLWSSGEESRSLTPQKRTEVANEIGDVLIYLLRLARTLDIDIIAAATDKLAQNRDKYPVDKAKGRSTKYVDFD
jgi:dCTP diphosphatase